MEQEIVMLLQKKDFLGLEKFIDFLGTDIIKTIAAILSRSEEYFYHQDVENEIFYRIWTKIDSYDPTKSSLKTWSLTIARNLSLDKKRKIIREQQLIPTEQLPEQGELDEYLEQESFLDLVKHLSYEDQLIFLKYYYYQDSPKEIAAELHLDTTQVYNHLSRGRKKLKETIIKEG